MTTYLSVCSGIEAATVAWEPLGWQPWAFAEVEAFPSAVLAHHYPNVPNLGDLTQWKGWPDATLDVLVGGTPCQSFSVAGLRKGLDDPRGGLLWSYLAVARRYRPRWVVWENVPGVLSIDDGRAFGTLLGGLVGLGYGVAHRVLDAQYFGLAQRRRRVFVVGCLGDWRRAAAVLFERASLSGHPAPRREAGQDVAGTVTSGAHGSGPAHRQRSGDARDKLIVPVVMSSGQANAEIREDGGAPSLTCLHEAPIVAHAFKSSHFTRGKDGAPSDIAPPLSADADRGDQDTLICAFDARQSDTLIYGDRSGPIDTNGHTIGVLAFSAKDHGADAAADLAPTLRAGGFTGSHANGGVMPAVAFNLRGREGGAMPELSDVASLRAASGGSSRSYVAGMTVRRLTPRECERLQGFPDDYTLIPYRGKPAADGPRYKALGNSMAVPVMRWIGRRMQMVDELRARQMREGA